MSKQRQPYIVGLIFVFLLDVVYFIWLLHSKGILPSFSAQSFVADIFSNLLYFLICSFICAILFSTFSKGSLSPKNGMLKKTIIVFLCMIVLTIATDALELVAWKSTHTYTSILIILLAVFSRLLLGWMLKKTFKMKLSNRHTIKPRQTIITVITSILFVAVCAVIAYKCISLQILMQNVSLKYSIFSSNYTDTLQNLSFLFEVYVSVLGLFADCYVLSLMYILSERTAQKNEHSASKLVAQSIIVLVALLMLCGIKMAILPHSSLSHFSKSDHTSSHFSSDEAFSLDTHVIEISQRSGYHSNDTVFCRTNGEIWFADKVLYRFSKDGRLSAYAQSISGNRVIINDAFESLTVGEKTVYILPDIAITFVENGEPVCVPFEQLSSCEENKLLIDFSFEMLQQGKLNYFEYCSEYLNQYSPELIDPFIQRYANGDFSETEISNVGPLNLYYIEGIAESMVR